MSDYRRNPHRLDTGAAHTLRAALKKDAVNDLAGMALDLGAEVAQLKDRIEDLETQLAVANLYINRLQNGEIR